MAKRKLRLGMIGGGPGSFIGPVHRMAALLDGEFEIVCGAFSSDAEKSKQTGAELNLDIKRSYGSYKEMIRRESEMPVHEKAEVISIVTPNHLHFEPAKLAIESGFHVIMDKPMTRNLGEAGQLKKIVDQSSLRFAITHTYTGYPMIKEARQQILNGKLGKIRKVFVEYPQGWLSTTLEQTGHKQASWRTDPEKSGSGGALADIGVHAFNLVEYVSGLMVINLCADVNSIVEGRQLDDDATIMVKFNNGASGVIICTQIAAGEENNIKLRVHGDYASLEWSHAHYDELIIKSPGHPVEIWRAGETYLSLHARHNTRLPAGHSEGLIGAFANIYRNFALTIKADQDKKNIQPEWEFPGITEGYRGMLFVEKTLDSAREGSSWKELE